MYLQSWPSTAVTTGHVLKISNQEIVLIDCRGLEPDTLASSRSRGDDSGIVNSHVDLIADNFGEAQILSGTEILILDKTMGGIRSL